MTIFTNCFSMRIVILLFLELLYRKIDNKSILYSGLFFAKSLPIPTGIVSIFEYYDKTFTGISHFMVFLLASMLAKPHGIL